MKKRAMIAVPVLLLAALATWIFFLRGDPAVEGEIRASGTVEATSVDLGFELPGRITEVRPREGELVDAGAALAWLDTTQLSATRNATAARLAAAEAQLVELRRGGRTQEVAQAEAAVRQASERAIEARREAERAGRLQSGGAVSRQALERAETASILADAQLEVAEEALALVLEGPREERIDVQMALVDQARAELERSDATIASAQIRAPFAGRITIRHREAGEIINAGGPVLTLLDPEDRWVRIYVSAAEIGRVQIGMRATIADDTDSERIHQGEVVFIGSEAEFTPRNVQTEEERTRLVYPVKVRITGDPEFSLKPGVPADVVLHAELQSSDPEE